jgi:hypothetical protein
MAITGTQKEIDEAKEHVVGLLNLNYYIPVEKVIVKPETLWKKILNVSTQCLVWFVVACIAMGIVGVGLRIIKWALAA